MIPNNGIHRINSCKINLGFGRAQHSSHLLWYWFKWGIFLIFDSFLWYMWLFCTYYWANPVSIEVLMLATQVHSLSPIFKILWTYMSLCVMSMFDIIFGSLDVYLICYVKKHAVYHISKLTLSCDSAWEAVQVLILTIIYVCD